MGKIVLLLGLALIGASALPAETTENGVTTYAEASNDQFPFMVSVQQLGGAPNSATACGGVLISLEHVLTTASCLNELREEGPLDPIAAGNIRVFAGDRNINNILDANRIRVAESFTVHPQYQGSPAYLNDIAIIKLTTPFVQTAVLKALGLPPHSESAQESATTCTLSGWVPAAVNTNLQPILKFATKTLLAQSECLIVPTTPAPSTTPEDTPPEGSQPEETPPGETPPEGSEPGDEQPVQTPQLFDEAATTTPTTICTEPSVDSTSGCAVLDGNPLVCDNQLVGILFHSNKCTANRNNEVFTRVAHYSPWIAEVTGIEVPSSSSTFKPAFAFVSIIALIQIVTSKFFI
ncbi:cationic trypsin-like [Trichoplusia ni]|uniref:Cationic trypsin-like n=1 Tax=Trichoplusia ni TaxID=7111 RepID=A0A7E5WAC7_TRINI|nr:cationic trypsin-like [Trichoplusia ni]